MNNITKVSTAFLLALSTSAAACEDPLRDTARFTTTQLEIADSKTNLVWFRCAGLANADRCVAGTPLPAEHWSTEVPRWLPKRRSAWRLASVEELDSIAARGCKYLTNPKAIEVLFDSVWTRTESAGGKVIRYGVDRERIESAKNIKGSDFAQHIYVRDAP